MEHVLEIESIAGGISPTAFDDSKDGYHAGLGIDPDMADNTILRPGGIIKPIAYAEFSGAEVNVAPMWLRTTPKNELLYTLLANGKFISYSSALGSETLIATATSCTGNGMVYYNNYIYIFRGVEVDRYGPIDGTPAYTTAIWTTATASNGFNQKAIQNRSYPQANQQALPNHVAHVHSDGALYFCDVLPDGKGTIHKIKTAPTLAYDGQTGAFTVGLTVTGGTSGATGVILYDDDNGASGILTLSNVIGTFADNETITDSSTGSATVDGVLVQGGGNDGSSFNVLDLPNDFWPTCLESWGNDLVIGALQSATSGQPTRSPGNSSLFFWDTISDSFYDEVKLKDPLTTALKNVNGLLYVTSGNGLTGCRVSVYAGGRQLTDEMYLDDVLPPYAGAVEALGDKFMFGTTTSYPNAFSVVYSFKSKDVRIKSQLHCPIKTSGSGAAPFTGALLAFNQNAAFRGRLLVGWQDNSASGIDQFGAASTLTSTFRKRWTIGREFHVSELEVPFDSTVAANTSLTITLYADDLSSSQALTAITNSTHPGNKVIVFKRPELNLRGTNDLTVDMTWGLTNPIGVRLPVRVKIRTNEASRTR